MATRKQWDNKIKALNKKHVKSGKELNAVLKELVDVSFDQLSFLIATAILKVYPRLVQRTPVDTGRARAGWLIGTKTSEYTPEDEALFKKYKGYVTRLATQEVYKNFQSLQEADVVYIINNIEYILALDAGWSKQNSGFIGLLLAELTQTFQALVKVNKAGTA